MALDLAPAERLDELFEIYMPLPIAPVEVTQRQAKYGEDDHHRLFPGEDERLKTPGLAQGELDERRGPRWAGLQYGQRWLHTRYHQFYPEGVELPTNEHQSFALGLLLSVGYAPQEAVDVSRRRPCIVTIDDDMRKQLQENLHQQYDRRWAIGWFFGRYITRHGLKEVLGSGLVNEFLDEKTNSQKRLRLGFRIISQAAEVVLDPVEPVYERARKRGQISVESPETARRFLMKHFNNRQPDYFEAIEQLATAA